MKKIIFVILFIAIIASLCACGNSEKAQYLLHLPMDIPTECKPLKLLHMKPFAGSQVM